MDENSRKKTKEIVRGIFEKETKSIRPDLKKIDEGIEKLRARMAKLETRLEGRS